MTGEEEKITWDNRGDYLGYDALQIGMLPVKTSIGAVEGWWNDWHKENGSFWNAGSISGALHGLSTGISDIGNPQLDFKKTEKTSLTLGAANIGDTMNNNRNTGTGNTASNNVGSPLPIIPADPNAEIQRQVLISLGQGVSDLHEAATRDGWTQENKNKLIELQAIHQSYAPEAKKLGSHAQAIVTNAGNTLDHLLKPHAESDSNPPANTAPFNAQQKKRMDETLALLATWQSGVIALNNEIAKAAAEGAADNGWTKARKDKLEALDKKEQEKENDIAKNLLFLTPEHKKFHADAKKLQTLLLSAKESNQPVALTTAALIPLPNKAETSIRGAPDDKDHIKPPAADTADADKKEDDKKSADVKKNSEKKEDKSSNAEKFNDESGNSGAGTRPVSHDTDDGSLFGSMGGHAKRLGENFSRWANVDGNDEVTNMVSSGLGLAGAAAEKGGGLVINTYDRLMAKQDRSGRSLIRDVGAGILSLIGMGSLVGPMLDRLGIGTIPIVGSLAKLAAVVVVFMGMRKGLDSFMPDVTPHTESSHLLQASNADRSRTTLPTLTQEEMNSGNVISMSNRGGPARTNIGNSPNRDPDAMQTASGNNTHVSADASSNFVHTGNVIHHPANFDNARNHAVRVDAGLHGASGGNVIPINFKPHSAPSVDGNLALRGNEL
jgi:hypothetical protein